MTITELLLIAVGLSMDAFAVSVCKGLSMKRVRWQDALVISLFFGGFQALMPLLGWILGLGARDLISSFDHYIIFLLLGYIGGKMVWEGWQGLQHKETDTESEAEEFRLDLKELLMLAVATSIDAFAVGITLAFLKVNVYSSVSIIGLVTFSLSWLGVLVGHKFGSKYDDKATIAGGLILIGIGIKVLLEHLDIL